MKVLFLFLLATWIECPIASALKEIVINRPLEEVGQAVVFEIQGTLAFPFRQAEEEGQMRSLFFQGDQVLESSGALNLKRPWCVLRVQIREEKTTFMQKGTRLHPRTFQKLQNNAKFDNYAYSFVDFSSGKSGDYQSGGWRPFDLRCSAPRGTRFHYVRFREATGYKFKIFPLKANP